MNVYTCQRCSREYYGDGSAPLNALYDHIIDGACPGFNLTGILGKREKIYMEKTTKNSAEWRKQRPLASGVLDYFPDALLEVAHTSWVGNEQHHPGAPLHWDKSKSTDEADALLRHLAQRGTLDTDGVRHSAKVAWRALALLQRELDKEREK